VNGSIDALERIDLLRRAAKEKYSEKKKSTENWIDKDKWDRIKDIGVF
jgi:hypothetical protein